MNLSVGPSLPTCQQIINFVTCGRDGSFFNLMI